MRLIYCIVFFNSIAQAFTQSNMMNFANELDSNNQKTGVWIYNNGAYLDSIVNYLHGKKNGDFYEYYLNAVITKKSYADDKLEGITISYNFDGFPLTITNYSNGLREGQHIAFYENRQIKNTIWFKNGEYDGLYNSFDENGKLEAVQNFNNGILNGFEIIYWENGSIQLKTYYENGKKSGIEEFYSQEGKIFKINTYKDNNLIDSIEY